MLVLGPIKTKRSGKLCNLAASRGVIALFSSGWEFLPFDGVSKRVSIVGLTSSHFNLDQVVKNFCLPYKCFGKWVFLSPSGAINFNFASALGL